MDAAQFTNIFLCILLFIQPTYFSLCNGTSTAGCRETERKALLEFKAALKDPRRSLSSWVGQDCCRWRGLQCDNRTGHVVRLDLHGIALGGEISSSLLGLKQLGYLDLSMNLFSGIRIPCFLGYFERLRYLNLSAAGFSGTVPQLLGNATSLHYLDLSAVPPSYFPNAVLSYSENDLNMHQCRWLSRLSSLRYINLNYVDLLNVSSLRLIQSLNDLQFLSEIHLRGCLLLSVPRPLPQANLTSLQVLDLSVGSFDVVTIFDWSGNISSLEYLDLSGQFFQERIPSSIGNLCRLSYLDVSYRNFGVMLSEFRDMFSGCIMNSLETLSMEFCNLTGLLPEWIGDFKNLKSLDLSMNSLSGSIPPPLCRLSKLQEINLRFNSLNGTVPKGLGQLSQLIALRLWNNDLNGVISEAFFANLTKLEVLDISSNHLNLDVGPDWVPPLGLREISLRSCQLRPAFPSWLRKLDDVSFLDVSDAGITDHVPEWFWNFSSKLSFLDLSQNGIKGKLPTSLKYSDLVQVYLESNQFEGPLPQFSSKLLALGISNNSLFGQVPDDIGDMMPSLEGLRLSANNFSGRIPSSLCKLKYLGVLDLSKNNFSGELPNCWNDGSYMKVIDLSYNQLHGSIPTSLSSLPSVEILHLNHNTLSGELPSSLKNCTSLVSLDLGENQFSGDIPAWMGRSLMNLKYLRLRSNDFVGHIPRELGSLPFLQVIDVAYNDLSGPIPHNFGNFSAMKLPKQVGHSGYAFDYSDSIGVSTKGIAVDYNEALLSLVILMDLSHNSLSGEIPEELTALYMLDTLNLSHNRLTGRITEKISGLQRLETLDLSVNNLSGAIPSSMGSLSFLNHLNLSFNNLSGEIPYVGQLEHLPDSSIYIGNDNLCGIPLETKCPSYDGASQLPGLQEGEGGDHSEFELVYLGLEAGFVIGFWAACGMLVLKNNWRIAYFRYVDNMFDRLYVGVVVSLNKMKRHMHLCSG